MVTKHVASTTTKAVYGRHSLLRGDKPNNKTSQYNTNPGPAVSIEHPLTPIRNPHPPIEVVWY